MGTSSWRFEQADRGHHCNSDAGVAWKRARHLLDPHRQFVSAGRTVESHHRQHLQPDLAGGTTSPRPCDDVRGAACRSPIRHPPEFRGGAFTSLRAFRAG
jgi:hypothetical protein